MECRGNTHLFLHIFLFWLTQDTKSEDPFCDNKCMRNGTTSFRGCHCDKACLTLYGDCCADARQFNDALKETGLRKRDDVVCQQFVKNRSTYLITGCSPGWRGHSDVFTYCKQLQREPIDPVGGAPATNYRTGVTYANHYCAVCNNEAENLTLWHIKLSCPSHPNVLMDEDEAFQRIVYDHGFKQWGYVVRDSFYGCSITYHTPRQVMGKVRWCYPDEVRSCSQSWKNGLVKEMCQSYTDPVYNNGTRYKNFYCAVCNRVDQSQMTCAEAIEYRTGVTEEPNPMSFSFLLDVNQSDGNKVGKKAVAVNCKKGEVLDPFARKCRNVVCGIPGYVMRNGSCTSESP